MTCGGRWRATTAVSTPRDRSAVRSAYPPRSYGEGDATGAGAALLVSIHDVSPLTLDESRRMVELAVASGVPLHAMTVLVIPRHEDKVPLDEHPATLEWLCELVAAGACLCLHGFTHRMAERTGNPWRWVWGQAFARGQGEFYLISAADAKRRLDAGRAIIERAGLSGDMHGIVPPAWLLSSAARRVVEQAGFAFHEELSGIVIAESGLLARRLIGFGSLGTFERGATVAHAWLQSKRRPADTRLAIHPADMNCAASTKAVRRTLRRLLPGLTPMSYTAYLRRCELASAKHRVAAN